MCKYAAFLWFKEWISGNRFGLVEIQRAEWLYISLNLQTCRFCNGYYIFITISCLCLNMSSNKYITNYSQRECYFLF